MKSEKGVTLTSIMIYVVALTIVVGIVGRITTYFYKNIQDVATNTSADAEYTKFNSYFTDEINIEENEVILFEENHVAFFKTENQYIFKNGNIYRNKAKICKDIDKCIFNYDSTTQKISVNIIIKGKDYSTTYTVVK